MNKILTFSPTLITSVEAHLAWASLEILADDVEDMQVMAAGDDNDVNDLKVEEKSRPLMRVIAGGHRAGKCETKYLQSSVPSFSLLFPSPHPLFFTPLSPTLSANAQSAKGMYDIDWLKLDQKTIYISTTFNPHLKSSIF